MEIEVAVARRAEVLPDQQDPDAAGRGDHHPRHHHRRGRHRAARRRSSGSCRARSSPRIGQLAAGVMHEINNPLATIGACVAAHREPAGDEIPAQHRAACGSTSRSSTRRCSAAPASWTGCSTSAGPRASARARCTSRPLLEETLFLLKHHQRFKKLTVEPRAGAASCRAVHGNAEQLIQVLHGADAERARRHGGGRHAHASAPAQPRPRDDEVVVEIEDTGVGIPRGRSVEDLRAVLHHQAAGPGYRARPLGLLRHRRASTAGASRWTASPGRVSVFRVFLPRRREGAGVKILVVEDDRTVGQYVKRGLEEQQLPGRPGGRRARGAAAGLGRAVRSRRCSISGCPG